MSRLSREKKRAQQYDEGPAVAVAPLDVRVPGGGPADIGGVPVVAADGQELQQAVLGHLHRIALATGHPVLATVHDERIGYVVPLRVEPDGSSHFAGEPLRVPPPREPDDRPSARPTEVLTPPTPLTPPAPPAEGRTPTGPDRPTRFLRREPAAEPRDEVPGAAAAPTGVFGPPPVMDRTPRDARPGPAPEPVQEAQPHRGSQPVQDSRPVPVPAPHAVQVPEPVQASQPSPASDPIPDPAPDAVPRLAPDAVPGPVSDAVPRPATDPVPLLDPEAARGFEPDPEPRPTPARGFDAVAEAVLGDDPRSLPGADGAPALLGEPMARINEAVRAGRTDTAAALAERTVTEASATLGPEHPEVLRLRELAAYIAYLAGDPVRSFHLSLDLAGIHRRHRDAEAAYGNVQSAATAWRAVRDPFQGLNLGTELLGLWTELATEEGPAADDAEELESARSRMTRLARRARDAGAGPQG
ncbi:tetratricopeptide repeat protein [Streptomyces sp. NPDC017202]|uniref:tetratricopeptide repeat protein n=1 Tax=Streptomyces sp. NPDC017202 TaxID=3364981 RepID=UPI0037B0AD0D